LKDLAPDELEAAPTREGEADAELVRLMNRYERSLYRFLYVLTGSQDVAMDCAQDAFVRAYDNLRRGRPVNAKWLYTVGRNRAMDEFRRKGHEAGNLELQPHFGQQVWGPTFTVSLTRAPAPRVVLSTRPRVSARIQPPPGAHGPLLYRADAACQEARTGFSDEAGTGPAWVVSRTEVLRPSWSPNCTHGYTWHVLAGWLNYPVVSIDYPAGTR
jgi:hypothetical protein